MPCALTSPHRSPSLSRRGALVCAVVLLHGCAAAPERKPAATLPPPRDALTPERKWLQQWFDGTPVRIAQRGDGPVSVDVPLAFCFDTGRSAVKPALAAVLDKVAQSLKRVPASRLALLAAPTDAGGPAALALQRAGALRTQLLSRGVAAGQIGSPAATPEAAVQLRLELPAA